MTPDQAYRKVGELLKPHGIRGEFIVFLESDFPQWLAERPCFYARLDNKMVAWNVVHARFRKDRLILKVDALENRDAVEAARGTGLYLPECEARAAIEDPDFFYNSDLIGLSMVDRESSTCFGTVQQVVEMPAQELLEVGTEDGETFLVPFIAGMVDEIDLEGGVIKVTLPEGLIDCNRP